jgi:Trp operon repressor
VIYKYKNSLNFIQICFMQIFISSAYVLIIMATPRKEIPIIDIKGLATLIKEGKTQQEMADYYGVDQATISRRFAEIAEAFKYLLDSATKPFIEMCEQLKNPDSELSKALEEYKKEGEKK